MGKIGTLVIPINLILNDIYEQKPARGGSLEIVVPAITMAESVHYETWVYEGEPDIEVTIDKQTNNAHLKHKGRKVQFIGAQAPVRDETYERISKSYTWVKARSKDNREETHKITFYWRVVKKAGK